MCGFIQRVTDMPLIAGLLSGIGLEDLIPNFENETEATNFYPAFGQNTKRTIRNLILSNSDAMPTTVDATWWFDCTVHDNKLNTGKRTTFNARNLESPFWKGAFRHNRAIVVATAIGESTLRGKTKHKYYMSSKKPF